MTVDIPNRDEQHGGMEAVGALSPHNPANWHEIAGYAVAARRADPPTTSNTP